MNTLRVVVIGTGFGARVHVPAYQLHHRYQLVGVGSMRQGRGEELGKTLGITGSSHWRQLIDELRPDVVSIATDPSWHRDMSIYAMEHDAHVLCEKPMALSLAEAGAMVRVSEDTGKLAWINHEFRYFPARQVVKEWIDGGKIGVPLSVVMAGGAGGYEAAYQRSVNWLAQESQGGGFLGAIGSHWIDTLRWWLGDIQYVTGELLRDVPERSAAKSRADDGFVGFLRLTSGASASLTWHVAAPPARGVRFEVMGTDATIRVDNDLRVWTSRGMDWEELAVPDAGWPVSLPTNAPHLLGNMTALLGDMARAIDGESASPLLVPFAEGYEVMRVMDAWTRSFQNGTRQFLL